MKKLLKEPLNAVPAVIKKIHFNSEHPENQNIKLRNKKLPYIDVCRHGEWETAYRQEILDDMIDRSYFMVDELYDEEKFNMREGERTRYEDYQSRYDNKEKVLMKRLNDDVMLVLINNRK